jgi:phospholipid/cholesterol/gamma-HCH transport system permease protein
MIPAVKNIKQRIAPAKKLVVKTLEDNVVSGVAVKSFFIEVAELTRFTGNFFKSVIRRPFELKELMNQSFLIGNKSLALISITGFIMGLVLTIQSRPTLAKFGAEAWLPGMVAISIVREIGPVITALIVAGKVGSGIGAELASMKVTEQIDAMEVSGTNPFKYIVVTRVLATTLMLPVLVIFADFIAFLGAFIGVNIAGHVSLYYFFTSIFNQLSFGDLFPAVIKTIFFGFFIGLVASYKGYNATKGTEGVGMAANSAVVIGSLCVFVIDMIAVQITALFVK